jgi:hypothetical protein
VFTLFEEGDKNIIKESQEREPGSGYGNGQGMEDLDEQTRELVDEFARQVTLRMLENVFEFS